MKDKRILQGMEWLNNQIEKDNKEININKQKLIKEILSIDKTQIFKENKVKKTSFFEKLLILLNYGKK